MKTGERDPRKKCSGRKPEGCRPGRMSRERTRENETRKKNSGRKEAEVGRVGTPGNEERSYRLDDFSILVLYSTRSCMVVIRPWRSKTNADRADADREFILAASPLGFDEPFSPFAMPS